MAANHQVEMACDVNFLMTLKNQLLHKWPGILLICIVTVFWAQHITAQDDAKSKSDKLQQQGNASRLRHMSQLSNVWTIDG